MTDNKNIRDKLIETRHKLYFSDSFLEQMSRTVRGPLYSIIEFSKLARDTKDSGVSIEHYLDQISRAGREMNESLDDVMAMRQIVMKNVSLHAESIKISDLVKALLNDMSFFLKHKGVEIDVKDDELKDYVIVADYSILFQVLRKMIRIVSETLSSKSRIEFDIYRNEEVNRILEIGFKVHGTDVSLSSSQIDALKLEYEGLEYDMYSTIDTMDPMIFIFRCYVHELGTDNVTVKKEDDGGLSIDVKIKFPYITGEQLAILNSRSYDFSKKRILVADDDEINLEIIDKLLRAKGAEVITVRDGREALLTYRTEHGKFDLILLDIVMPDIDGLAVARQIRDTTTIPTSKNIPIIAMTVNAFHENYEQSLKAGMNSHLVKPIDSGRLYNTLAEYI
ncbi:MULTISPECIES: response regulator [unclassified Butyrivibrio]|uniref:response regulator n=1 Tax=unclassified Butyrivibrio TaxID=2639466 RepID=UPI0003FD378F|nr:MULTISPECIES: response regulator [unclassified Butyrivibrio]